MSIPPGVATRGVLADPFATGALALLALGALFLMIGGGSEVLALVAVGALVLASGAALAAVYLRQLPALTVLENLISGLARRAARRGGSAPRLAELAAISASRSTPTLARPTSHSATSSRSRSSRRSGAAPVC